jgi:hypothetical protein
MIGALAIAKRPAWVAAICAFCLLGCGKKQSPPSSPSSQPKSDPAPAAQNAVPAPAPPATAAAAPAESYDAVVTARSIDYFKGQIDRKNWDQARRALAQIEGRSLTPAQRQYVDSLKAQLPPK